MGYLRDVKDIFVLTYLQDKLKLQDRLKQIYPRDVKDKKVKIKIP